MSAALEIVEAGQQVTVQDAGRDGTLGYGLSRGGAVDAGAVAQGGALLGQGAELAVLEMAGMGGAFRARGDLRIALTGAVMSAAIEGSPVAWNASHALKDGEVIRIGAARSGVFGYLSVGGGLETPRVLGSRSINPLAGVGAPLSAGAVLPVGADRGGPVGMGLDLPDVACGGAVRVLRGPQTGLFTDAMLARFTATEFQRDARSNRQAARLVLDGDGFSAEGGLSVLSEIIVPGDIQITGDGTPFVLMPDCQTAGGYPRLGTVLPCDLARVAQAGPDAPLTFSFVDRAEALTQERAALADRAGYAKRLFPLVRDPHDIRDLASYQLIGGISSGDELG